MKCKLCGDENDSGIWYELRGMNLGCKKCKDKADMYQTINEEENRI